VHIRFPTNPEFRLLGAISASKPSAVFRVRPTEFPGDAGEVTLGISVEDAASVEAQLSTLPSAAGAAPTASGALVKAQKGVGTLQLARRIIGNAFNYLSSFSVVGQGGEEMVPLKAFREWWIKFEKKVEYDPTFLEREEEC
jgi:hypothetical protein